MDYGRFWVPSFKLSFIKCISSLLAVNLEGRMASGGGGGAAYREKSLDSGAHLR
jgi:hypothetical protein